MNVATGDFSAKGGAMKILGTHLCERLQRECKARFVHRFTKEHKPTWATERGWNGRPFPVQFASDADWLAHTYFHVTKKGELSNRHSYCESTPTWPNNPELRKDAR